MTAKEVLIDAKNLISDPNNWLRTALACDKEGFPVDPEDKNACKWCASGALLKVAHGEPLDKAVDLLLRVLDVSLTQADVAIPIFNDNSTHEEVMELFDKAINT